jgi:xanthine dehydrogenase accessory factor
MTDSAERLCVIRGGGDLATGVAWRLSRAGFPVVVTELPTPLTVRRTVALSSAVSKGTVDVEGMIGRLASSSSEAVDIATSGDIGVFVSPDLPKLGQQVVVDARLAKRNIDTTLRDAPLVVALGPGFTAEVDCHAVVETKRGHHLGRVLWTGSAAPDTGTPGVVEGRAAERVLRAPTAGEIVWQAEIGDVVTKDTALGTIGNDIIAAPFDGMIRGLIADRTLVAVGLKVGDVDPRNNPAYCSEISDKALAIGGGVLEAVLLRNGDGSLSAR